MDTLSNDSLVVKCSAVEPLLRPEDISDANTTSGKLRVYPSRWYIAVIVSALSVQQCCIWLTFGPVSSQALTVFGIDNSTVGLLSAYGCIAFVTFGPLYAWLMDKYGLKWTLLIGGGLLDLIAAGLRCIATGPSTVWAIHLAQFINGLVGCAVLIAPAKISQVWFPPHERATATTFITLCNYLGSAVGFVVIPWQVESFGMTAMLKQWAVVAALTAVVMMAYFPNAPPTAPSITAATKQSAPTLSHMKTLIRSPEFLLLILAGAVANGFYTAFTSIISVILLPAPWNYTDNVQLSSASDMLSSSAWVGMWATLIGVLAGFAVGPFVDRTQSHKRVTIWFFAFGVVAFLWFLLTIQQYMPGNRVTLLISILLSSLAISPTCPLTIELACEVAYPAPPATVDAAVQIATNGFALVFQLIGIGSSILNDHPATIAFLMPVACFISMVLFIFVKGEHRRLKIDEGDAPTAVIAAQSIN